jgi:hypothetical protein
VSSISSSQVFPTADSTTSPVVVVLSPEQAKAAWVELRDDQGEIVGYLARQCGTSHFFSPEQMEVIKKRAQSPPVGGKTAAEIFEMVRQRMQG